MIQAYQAGVSALKLSLKDVTVERAENLVDQIQEVDQIQDPDLCGWISDVS